MDVYIKSGTRFYSISDGTIAGLASYSGTGLSTYHTITERGPFQHGESYVDFRMDPRDLILTLVVKAPTDSELDSKLAQLAELCKPRESGMVSMKFVTDGGIDKRASAYYVDGLELARAIGDGKQYRVPVAFRIPEGTFSSPLMYTLSFYANGGTGKFAVPMTVPVTVGGAEMDETKGFYHSGTFRTYPIITITGPITDCVITQISTNEKLDFTGTTIAAGETREIDCRFGYKTVKDGAGTSCINELSNDSDLGTFHIACPPDVPNGANAIRVTGSAITSNTSVVFMYYRNYAYL